VGEGANRTRTPLVGVFAALPESLIDISRLFCLPESVSLAEAFRSCPTGPIRPESYKKTRCGNEFNEYSPSLLSF
jgi:hypothetical protein